MFQTIGKYWAQGVLPYSGLWDSKGPIIFGINALGYLLTNSKTGIFIIELVCIFLSEYIIYKMFSLKYSFKRAFILTVLMIYIGWLDYASDSTEEFLMPLLLLSFYLMYHELDRYHRETEEFTHNAKFAFIYGITFSFCLLTRLTNAIGLCAGILVIVIGLIIRRQWKSLLKNALAFIIGFLLLTVPFILYFYVHGILYDAVYGTLLYNFDYAAHAASSGSYSLRNMILMLTGYSSGILLGICGLIEIVAVPKRRLTGFAWLLIGVVTSVWLFRSNQYLHYGLIEMPYLIIAINELKVLRSLNLKKNLVYKGYRVILAVFLICCCLGSLSSVWSVAGSMYNQLFAGETDQYKRVQSEMLKAVPSNERNDFIAYNTNTGFYLQHNIRPCYRFFTFQDWAALRSKSLTKLVKKTYAENKAKWIFVSGDPDETLISDITEEKLSLRETEKGTIYGKSIDIVSTQFLRRL